MTEKQQLAGVELLPSISRDLHGASWILEIISILRFLSQEESWDLFCRKLLDVQAMVSAMERLAKDMVDRCGGLPLAVVVLSGLLSHKRGFEEWKKVKDHLWQHIKDDSIEISYILSLSYNDLSTALKQCFLYFGIIPKDHEKDSYQQEKKSWRMLLKDS
ncbi:hypothetical protein RDI58_009944 [Solanum bulbocastanum]|uniref:NB-ARC domain-containing protein n=1 Tax=Solanum bulbocastanum TaxID=147425 RepID=A0AAN8TLW8_SOLBU